jgi:hypothetical protein
MPGEGMLVQPKTEQDDQGKDDPRSVGHDKRQVWRFKLPECFLAQDHHHARHHGDGVDDARQANPLFTTVDCIDAQELEVA